MNKNYQLGNFICSLREEFGMDQKTLAQLLGVSPSAISQCENGGGIKTEKLFQLSELFGVTIDELLAAKHLNQTLEDKWDKLYNISNYNLPELIENGNVGAVKEFYKFDAKDLILFSNNWKRIKEIFKNKTSAEDITGRDY